MITMIESETYKKQLKTYKASIIMSYCISFVGLLASLGYWLGLLKTDSLIELLGFVLICLIGGIALVIANANKLINLQEERLERLRSFLKPENEHKNP